ncbi:MAG: helix-turn-helix transcriptional regulator [Clostridia bacterium]|nr:helix-turn-helix transcriptional regulator [Clostridia bacterium]
MTFGEKLKKLRTDNRLTQDELAEKLYVTRTAISKWETNKGFPNIDSLKLISNTFQISLDELCSDEAFENKKLQEAQFARKMYYCAVAAFLATALFAILSVTLSIKYLNIGSFFGGVAYMVFAFLSKPKYKRVQGRENVFLQILLKFVMVALFLSLLIGF